MIVKHGEGRTEFGPGVSIELSGAEVAMAIDAWLVTRGVHVSGPRTVKVNGELCRSGRVYVDPSGFVIADGKKISGRGPSVPEVRVGATYRVAVGGLICRSGFTHLRGELLEVVASTSDAPFGEVGPRGTNWVVRTKHDVSVWATLESCVERGLLEPVSL